MTTVHERVAAARQTLGAAGIGALEAASSARVLAQHVLGWDTPPAISRPATSPSQGGFADRYEALVARRAAREPAAYITGRKEFWDMSFEVSQAVLIPRPETELIVEAALEILAAGPRQHLEIADACTGCGNLAVALAHELGHVSIVATDISADALAVAQRNAAQHGVADRIRFVQANVLEGVDGPFDLIVANPPYVKRGDRPALQPEVRDHEPGVALFGGVTGTELVAVVVGQAAGRLQRGGSLMFEFGFGQEMVAEALIAATPGLTLIGLRRDLQGLARMAVARRRIDA